MTANLAIALVVPCYNEAERLDTDAFTAMVDADLALSLVFVDDGSRDGTAGLHAGMASDGPGGSLPSRCPKTAARRTPSEQGSCERYRSRRHRRLHRRQSRDSQSRNRATLQRASDDGHLRCALGVRACGCWAG